MDPLLTIRTPRLLLRVAGPDDASRCVDYNRRNARYLAPWEPTMTEQSFDAASMAARRERAVTAAREGTAYSFALLSANDIGESPILGWINLHNVVRGVFQASTLGYNLDQRAQGHGFMTEAAQGVIDFAFNTLHLHRLMANYMPHNQRSGALLRRLGFTIEGSAKAYLYIAGAWRDHVLTSLTNPEPTDPIF